MLLTILPFLIIGCSSNDPAPMDPVDDTTVDPTDDTADDPTDDSTDDTAGEPTNIDFDIVSLIDFQVGEEIKMVRVNQGLESEPVVNLQSLLGIDRTYAYNYKSPEFSFYKDDIDAPVVFFNAETLDFETVDNYFTSGDADTVIVNVFAEGSRIVTVHYSQDDADTGDSYTVFATVYDRNSGDSYSENLLETDNITWHSLKGRYLMSRYASTTPDARLQVFDLQNAEVVLNIPAVNSDGNELLAAIDGDTMLLATFDAPFVAQIVDLETGDIEPEISMDNPIPTIGVSNFFDIQIFDSKVFFQFRDDFGSPYFAYPAIAELNSGTVTILNTAEVDEATQDDFPGFYLLTGFVFDPLTEKVVYGAVTGESGLQGAFIGTDFEQSFYQTLAVDANLERLFILE